MSEHVNMPVRRLKALNYEEQLQGKGDGETRVKLFSSEEMMERMLQKKKNQNQDNRSEEDETRRRREYQQQLFMLHDGPPDDDEEADDVQKDDMQQWLQSLHLKTQNIIDKCKTKATRPLAATHVATAAVRLKGKKTKNPSDARDSTTGDAAENVHDETANENAASDKSSSEFLNKSDEIPAPKEAHRKSSDESKPSGEMRRPPVHHAKAASSKQLGHQKREGKSKHMQPSFKHRSHRQKAAHQSDI